jgi:hypothetical protein
MDKKSSPKKCTDQEKVELPDKAINEVIENEYEKAILESTGILTVTSEQYKEYFDICYQFLAVENGHRYNIRQIPHEGNTDPQKNGIRIGLSFISLQRGKNGLEKDTTKYLLSEDDPVFGIVRPNSWITHTLLLSLLFIDTLNISLRNLCLKYPVDGGILRGSILCRINSNAAPSVKNFFNIDFVILQKGIQEIHHVISRLRCRIDNR